MTMDSQKFCLKWDGFQSSVTSLFDSLRQVEELVDITLCCEGLQLRAHRMMLSACSPYFRQLLKNNPCQQMAIFLKDTSAADLSAVIEFMYKGSVNVSQSQLASFIKTAEMLQIRGLSGDEENRGAPPPSPRRAPSPPPPAAVSTPPHKRRRLSGGSTSGRRSPVSPGRRPRSPSPPPAAPPPQQPPPPPPPPLPSAAPLPSDMDPAAQQQSGEQHVPPPPPGAPAHAAHPVVKSEPVKVEKIDLTEDDDDVSLDSTLCHVAEYEGGPVGEYDESYDGSNSGLDHQMGALSEMGGLPPLGAGPSRGPPGGHGMSPMTPGSQHGDDGSGSGPHACDICGRRYQTRNSVNDHRKLHTGETTCQLCGKVYNRMPALRRHLMMVHNLSAEEARTLTYCAQSPRWEPEARM